MNEFRAVNPLSQLIPSSQRREFVYSGVKRSEGYTRNQLGQIVKREGQNPFDYVLKRVSEGVRIIGVGGIHWTKTESTRLRLIEALTEKSDVKIGTIALEIDKNLQHVVDEYMATGKMTKAYIKLFWRTSEESIGVIKYARSHGIKVACIDGREKTKYERDANLNRRISEIAQSDPNHVTIAFLGVNHVLHEHFDSPSKQSYQKLSDMYGPETYLSLVHEVLPALITTNVPREGLVVPVKEDVKFNKTLATYGYPYGNSRAILFMESRHPFHSFAKPLLRYIPHDKRSTESKRR